MHRFHISPGSEKKGIVALDREESHHALAVLRVQAGDVVELLDGQGGTYSGVITGAEKGRVTVSVGAASPSKVPNRVQITLAASVIKPERMELLVQKACELGASSIVPLISERTVVRLSRERWQGKIVRWRKIVSESCKQCGQPVEPKIHEVVELTKFAATFSQYDLILIPTLAVPVTSLQNSLNASKSAEQVLILIGPEGDFSPHEVQLAVSSGAQAVTLGALVMRSETAALYTLSVVRYFYGI